MKYLLTAIIFVHTIVLPVIGYAFPTNFGVKNESKTEFIGKLGTSYVHELDSYGLDLSFNYVYKIDPYFRVGAETGLLWLQWEQTLGQDTGPPVTDVVADTDVYMVPVFLNAQIRVPYLDKKYSIEPYLTVGLGWNFAYATYNRPSYVTPAPESRSYSKEDMSDFYHGFAWQLVATIAISPSAESKVKFLADVGYRGASPENSENEKIRLSGMLLRVGVIIPL